MKKFVFIYHGSVMPETTSKEDMQATMSKWMAWFDTFKDKMVDGGNPFAPGAKAVSHNGTTDVAATMASTGYTIINAHDMAEAVAIAKGCPIVASTQGDVRVYEVLPM